MSVELKYTEAIPHIMTLTFKGSWTIGELDSAMTRVLRAKSVSRVTHLVFNMEQTRFMPNGMLVYLRRILRVMPDQNCEIVIAGDDPSVLEFVELFRTVFESQSVRVSWFNALQTAITYVHPPNNMLFMPLQQGTAFSFQS
ncbi:MAG: hypothetical protein ACOCX3_01085 [Chloroflexota bacterium]